MGPNRVACGLLLLAFLPVAACESDGGGGGGGGTPTGGASGGDAQPTGGAGGAGGQITHDAGPRADAALPPDWGTPPPEDVGVTPISDAVVPSADIVTPPPPPPCATRADCEGEQVCDRAVPGCDPAVADGECVEPPSACGEVEDPVCGCDGETYPNACLALQAGVPLVATGPCRDAHCDDGLPLECAAAAPVCPEGQVPAVRAGCWLCVNAATCLPPASCVTDADCSPDDRCDPCAHPSCPVCADCVAECVPHGCQSENQPACDEARPACGADQVAVVRDGCWLCVERSTCEPVTPPGGICDGLGGYCEAWDAQCREGYVGDFPHDCPHGRSAQCCVPAPVNCTPVGESGAVVPGALPCCPGLTTVGCERPANGGCDECVGAFFCILPGDGLCGPAENVCNSPVDCAPPGVPMSLPFEEAGAP